MNDIAKTCKKLVHPCRIVTGWQDRIGFVPAESKGYPFPTLKNIHFIHTAHAIMSEVRTTTWRG